MIVVTGANGLVGSSVIKKFIQEGMPVRGTVRAGSNLSLLEKVGMELEIREADILDMPGLLKAFDGAEIVVHCAALVSFNPNRRNRILEINIQGTRNVVNACLRLDVPKLIHVSTVAALGRHKGSTSIDEKSVWVPGGGESDYAESKYLSELEVFRGMEEGLMVSIVNPSVIFSPGDGIRSSSQIFGYVWKERSLYTDGFINYVDVRDVAEMIFKLFREIRNGERFIASAGRMDLKWILHEIAMRLQRKAPSVKVPPAWIKVATQLESWRARLTGKEPLFTGQSVRFLQENYTYQNSKAMSNLGMQFQTLEKTLDWCCHEFRNNNTNK